MIPYLDERIRGGREGESTHFPHLKIKGWGRGGKEGKGKPSPLHIGTGEEEEGGRRRRGGENFPYSVGKEREGKRTS